MFQSVNHCNVSTLSLLPQEPRSWCIHLMVILVEIRMSHLGTGKTSEKGTVMISIGEQNTEGKMIMQLGGRIEVLRGERFSISVELIIKVKDMLMSKMMLEAIWCKAE